MPQYSGYDCPESSTTYGQTSPFKIGIIMDPIGSITPYKDSSLAMLLEAERRGAEIHYFEQSDVRHAIGWRSDGAVSHVS